MNRLLLRAPLLLAALLLAAPATAASPCEDHGDGMATGPSARSFGWGELGRPHRACGRSEVGLDAGGFLIVDLDNFYGRLSASARLRGSWAVHPRVELLATLPVIRAEVLITPLAATSLGLGSMTIGAAWRGIDQDRFALTLLGRAALPTQAGFMRHVAPMGVEGGLSFLGQPHPRIGVHGSWSVLGTWGIGDGIVDPRAAAVFDVGAQVRVGKAFSFAADLVGKFDEHAPVDHLAGAFGLRFSDGKRFGFHLAGTIPFVGAQRAVARVDLGATVRLGKLAEWRPTRDGG